MYVPRYQVGLRSCIPIPCTCSTTDDEMRGTGTLCTTETRIHEHDESHRDGGGAFGCPCRGRNDDNMELIAGCQ